MRGLQVWYMRCNVLSGITPAHAGLTLYIPFRHSSNRDHPRACGAYGRQYRRPSWFRGSPPRMRGLPTRLESMIAIEGITPAHAGLTNRRSSVSIRQRDHPRACGAYDDTHRYGATEWGSPPRMRGLRHSSAPDCISHGITPAHAGLTSLAASPAAGARDHPRACGAYGSHILSSSEALGSPPRMRGLRAYYCFW